MRSASHREKVDRFSSSSRIPPKMHSRTQDNGKRRDGRGLMTTGDRIGLGNTRFFRFWEIGA
jgi:hypothetical protein